MKNTLSEKVAVITGSSGALGSATIKLFLENGASVVALYHTEEKYRKLLKALSDYSEKLIGVLGDATKATDCEKLIQTAIKSYSKVDILVNIVGGWKGGSTIDKTSVETWNYMMDLNAKSMFLCCRAVLPYMVERNYGKIVSISAKSSMPEGRMKNSSAYAASKGVVRILTQAMTQEYMDKGININCIMPSTIDTLANREMMPKADFSKWVPPELIAETILFLCSDQSAEIKGASIPVYGRS